MSVVARITTTRSHPASSLAATVVSVSTSTCDDNIIEIRSSKRREEMHHVDRSRRGSKSQEDMTRIEERRRSSAASTSGATKGKSSTAGDASGPGRRGSWDIRKVVLIVT